MANQLAMDKVQAIKSLKAAGLSERKIAEALSISRNAVRRHFARGGSKDTKAPTGKAPTGSTGSKDTEALTGSPEPEDAPENLVSGTSRSLCQGYQQTILAKLEQGLTAQRIFQDLRDEHGFTGKYHSVRRYVRRLSERSKLAFRRIEVEPGDEMQVDFGSGARCQDHEGKWSKTHVFRLVLKVHRRLIATESAADQEPEAPDPGRFVGRRLKIEEPVQVFHAQHRQVQAELLLVVLLAGTEHMGGQAALGPPPDLRNSKGRVNAHSPDGAPANFRLDDQIRWRIDGEVDFQAAPDPGVIEDVVALVGLTSLTELAAFPRRRSEAAARDRHSSVNASII